MKVLNIVRVCLFLMALACVCTIFGVQGIVHAQDETVSPMTLSIAKYAEKIISVILPAAAMAAFVSYLGYKKSHLDGEYDKAKLIYTAAVAIVASILTTAAGMTYADLAKYGVDGFVTVVLYWASQWLSPHLKFIPATNPSASEPPVAPTPVDLIVKVVDKVGNPIVGANVQWRNIDGMWENTTDINGNVNVGSTPVLRYVVTADGFVQQNAGNQIPSVIFMIPVATQS